MFPAMQSLMDKSFRIGSDWKEKEKGNVSPCLPFRSFTIRSARTSPIRIKNNTSKNDTNDRETARTSSISVPKYFAKL
ncbi:hypothetical protein EFP84_05735 [Leptospira kmetyi]|uniref:Uncharacterized protein n=1 Tax=Leptospira kmetyi TaxID=408139 RepID=A0AAD0ULH9_9LEPT|nr:hypothetical protein EFP84_05735 [Leptospira kmetyi]